MGSVNHKDNKKPVEDPIEGGVEIQRKFRDSQEGVFVLVSL